jgi:hypothetical protein
VVGRSQGSVPENHHLPRPHLPTGLKPHEVGAGGDAVARVVINGIRGSGAAPKNRPNLLRFQKDAAATFRPGTPPSSSA